MEDILALLTRVSYPASREDLIDAAAAHGMTVSARARLESLENRQYASADDVSFDLVGRRAESNPSIVAVTAEACERCGFLRTAGEPHSCVEEKALFADAVNAVTDSFEQFDESAARQGANRDQRTGGDRRHSGTQIAHSDERRHPVRQPGDSAGPAADNGGQRRGGR